MIGKKFYSKLPKVFEKFRVIAYYQPFLNWDFKEVPSGYERYHEKFYRENKNKKWFKFTKYFITFYFAHYILLYKLDEVPLFYINFLHFIRSIFIIFIIIIDYKLLPVYQRILNQPEDEILKDIHKRASKFLLNLCLNNGSIFIKIGQHIAALNNIIPPEYTETFKVCQDSVTPFPFEKIEKEFYKQMNQKIEDVFMDFSKKPLACASIGQVHKAVLANGKKVAVKIQYPRLEESLENDLKIIDLLIHISEFFFKDLHLNWIIREFKINLPSELDFINEGKNSERLQKNFEKIIKTPKIYWYLTNKKVITMEFIDGKKLTKENLIEMNINSKRVSQILSSVFAKQIFLDGLVHCDPHMGNIMIRKAYNWDGFELVFLDHGLYKVLDDQFRKNYSTLWKSLILKDYKKLNEICKELGVDPNLFHVMLTYETWDRHLSFQELQNFGKENFINVLNTLSKLSSEMILLLKANELLRSLQTNLGSYNYIKEFAYFAVYSLRKNESFWNYFYYTFILFYLRFK